MSAAAGLTFLTGGARSGKSRLAVEMGKSWPGPVGMIVTARADDDEMTERIELHRAHRPESWTTVEAPEALDDELTKLQEDAFAIVDCLTLWVSNLLAVDLSDDEIDARASAAVAAALARPSPVVVITNEVGSGIVPLNALARRYRDVLGRVNAAFSQAAAEAYLVVAGRLLRLELPDGR
jgi:adenosyl cobinamide kinase/adenosyl cobinamide phosphate guanylyltransferase